LEAQNSALAKQNDVFAVLNQNLNGTAQKMEVQIGTLESEVDDLNGENSRLEGLVDSIQKETVRLEGINLQLSTNVSNLELEVDRLKDRTEELQELNDEFGTIASFMEQTAGNLDGSYQALTAYLSEQIDVYRSVATETLQNTYIQRVSVWDCAYRSHFGDEDFAYNDGLEIPDEKFDEVIDYINGRVLNELCLSKDDFVSYLLEVFDDPVFTSNHFVSGINSYTLLAMNFYFPDAGEAGGLTAEDWATAQYSCERLPSDKLFLHSTSRRTKL